MVNFEDLNLTQLRQIVSDYNLHFHIPRFSKMKKAELLIEIKKHLKIEGDIIKTVMTSFEQHIPESTKSKKIREKASKAIESIPNELKQFLTPEAKKTF